MNKGSQAMAIRKILAATMLLLLIVRDALADEMLVPASIIPSSEWVYWEVQSVKCRKPVDVPFRMDAIGSQAKFTAHAEVCGDFDEAKVLELLRLVDLASVASKHDKPWRVSIKGNAHAVAINFNVINACNVGADWLIGRRFGHWAIFEPMLVMHSVCPEDFQPVLLPQLD